MGQKYNRGRAVSETDSFIDEVTEAVRRDQLFAAFKKYGWIGILAVVLIVGGAAWNEWQKAAAAAKAQAFGDALTAAVLKADPKARVDALKAISLDDAPGRGAVLGLVTAAEAEAAGEHDAAVAALQGLVDNAQVPDLYRQMASLRLVALDWGVMDKAKRDAMLQGLATPGAPLRTLAMEQQAMALLEDGKTEAAVALLQEIQIDAQTPAGQQSRLAEILTAFGVKPADDGIVLQQAATSVSE